MASTAKSELCDETLEHLAEVLDGSASERLLAHVAECDTCRDARHDAEEARRITVEAGGDYRTEPDLEARVLAALDARVEDAAAAPLPASTMLGEESREKPKSARMAPKPGPRRIVGAVVGLGLAAAAVAFMASGHHARVRPDGTADAWAANVERVVSARGEARVLVCDAAGAHCFPAGSGTRLTSGSRLKTDAATRAELVFSDRSRVTLDRATELTLLAGSSRLARLEAGSLVADITHQADEARFELPAGAVTVHGTKFALHATQRGASVDVSRGSVTLADVTARSVRVVEGETGRLEPNAGPSVGFSSALGDSLGWSDEAFGDDTRALATRGLGELRAKKPGQDDERTGAVTLAAHQVRVRIAGVVARTEVEEVFENHTDDVLEGIYRFPLPPGAQIERLALDVDGKLEDGAFVDRERAAAIFRGALVNAAPKQPKPVDEIVWVPGPWRDPALLEWQRGGRFELRIFPIPRHGSRRVRLAYTELVPAAGGARRYTYPLAYDPSGSTRIGHFSLDLEVRGHDREFGVRPSGYALGTGPAAPDSSAWALASDDFVPTGDLGVEYALPAAASELVAWTYLDPAGTQTASAPTGKVNLSTTATRDTAARDTAPYVAFALHPKLPRPERAGGRAVALVIDASRSMLGANYERASELAVRLAGEFDESDRLTVLACAVECEVFGQGGFVTGAATTAGVRRFLSEITPEGASDLVGAVDRALGELGPAAGLARHVVFVGDGAPTVGQVRPGSIERAVARSVARTPANIVSVAIGGDADTATLDAVARGGDGMMLPFTPGRSTAEMTYAVLAATAGGGLGSVSVTLPEGLRGVAPARLSSIPAGGEAFVLARMDNLEVSGDVVLRGRVLGKPFEQHYPVALTASSAPGNAFVPRLYAAAKIADLEREGTDAAKAEAIGLSTAFSVASRYTSLLVLESPAMFRAFGLEQAANTAVFTADEASESTSAEGADDVGADDDAAEPKPAENVAPASPAPAAAMAAPPAPRRAQEAQGANKQEAQGASKKSASQFAPGDFLPFEEPPRRRMIPMRRVWERSGELFTDRFAPVAATPAAIANAKRVFDDTPNRRDAVKKAFTLLLEAGDVRAARGVAGQWVQKEPLGVEALTALADAWAASGYRGRAIRVLGSVLDVRPGDVASGKRLARLERWAGRPAVGCRFSIALAEQRPGDAASLAEAVRCAQATLDGATAEELEQAAAPATRAAAERILLAPPPDDQALRGDLRLEASWRGGEDLDLALIDPDGHRVSWLGAPTRGIITARDVTSTSDEALALTSAKPGEYVIEIVNATHVEGGAPCSGELTLSIAGSTRRIPFSLNGLVTRLGVARISLHSRLVPL